MTSIRTVKRAGLLVVAAAASFALAACSGGGSGSTGDTAEDSKPAAAGVDPHAPEVDTITGPQYRQNSALPFLAAEASGVAADYGITLKPVWAESSLSALTQLMSGEGQIASVSTWSTVDAVNQGMDIRIVGEIFRSVPDAQTLEVLPDSGINGLADLQGKKVAVIGLKSGHEGRIVYAMIKEGLDPSKVEFVSLPFGEMAAALEQHTVDAVSVTGPFQEQVRQQLGSKKVFDYGDGLFAGFPDMQWVTSGEFADNNPNAVAAFQCAVVIKGAKMMTEDDWYDNMARDGLGWDDKTIASTPFVDYPGTNDAKRIQMIPDIMYTNGWIDKEFDVSKITVPLPDNC